MPGTGPRTHRAFCVTRRHGHRGTWRSGRRPACGAGTRPKHRRPLHTRQDRSVLVAARALGGEEHGQPAGGHRTKQAQPFHRVLFALGIRHVGAGVARTLADAFPSPSKRCGSATEETLRETPAIGPKIAASIVHFFGDTTQPRDPEVIEERRTAVQRNRNAAGRDTCREDVRHHRHSPDLFTGRRPHTHRKARWQGRLRRQQECSFCPRRRRCRLKTHTRT